MGAGEGRRGQAGQAGEGRRGRAGEAGQARQGRQGRRGRAGRAGEAGQAGRGQTKSPRRLTGGSDRGKGLSALDHFEAVKGIDPLCNRGHWPHGEDRGDLRAPVIRLQKDRFTWEAQRLRRDFRRFGCGCGCGCGGALAFEQSGKGEELRGGNSLGFHGTEFYPTAGNPRREPEATASGPDTIRDSRLIVKFKLQQKKRPGVSSGLVSILFQHLAQREENQHQHHHRDHATVTVPLRASANAARPTTVNRSQPSGEESDSANSRLREALTPNSDEVQRANGSLVPVPVPLP